MKTDISRYYHSIYTHTLPWALNGKSASKKDRKVDSKAVFGNRLDHILRQAQDGQTIGIPVGPDFSRYISEIIGKAIDQRFRDAYGDQVIMVRHVDDFYVGSDNPDQASQLRNGIRDAIRQFQIDVNDNKTAVIPTNLDLEPFSTVRIRREISIFKEGAKKHGKSAAYDFTFFLDELVHMANQESDDGLVKYAIRAMDRARLWDKYWEIAEPFLVRSAINFPHCWEYVSQVAARRYHTVGLDETLWGSVVSKSLIQQASFGNNSEVCWILWLAKEANLQIPLSSMKKLSSVAAELFPYFWHLMCIMKPSTHIPFRKQTYWIDLATCQ